jgi:excisionase family DNA binding protein
MSSAEATAILGENLYQVLVELVRAEVDTQSRRHQLVSKEKLAELLGVKPRTIKTLRSKGLPGHRVGKEVFYKVEEVEKWIEEHAA